MNVGEIVPKGRVNSYVILSYIAKGGYGSVYKAKHINSKDIVAIKVIPWEKLQNEARRILREIKILQQIRHPNLICCLDLFILPYGEGEPLDVGFDCCIVMPFVPRTLLSAAPYDYSDPDPRRNEVLMVSQLYYLLRGLDYYHKCGLIHRDLSPRNVLISANPNITFDLYIADFGLSRESTLRSGAEMSFYVTTRPYRAPEIIASQAVYSNKIDIWALGCILAECLIGHPLFQIPTSYNKVGTERVPELVGKQIFSIVEILGAPNEDDLTDYDANAQAFLRQPAVQKFRSQLKTKLHHECIVNLPNDALEDIIALITDCLAFGCHKRPSAEDILSNFPLFKKHHLWDPKQQGLKCIIPEVSKMDLTSVLRALCAECHSQTYSPFTAIATSEMAKDYCRQLIHFESIEHCKSVLERLVSHIQGLQMHLTQTLPEEESEDTERQMYELTEIYVRLLRFTDSSTVADELVSQNTVPNEVGAITFHTSHPYGDFDEEEEPYDK